MSLIAAPFAILAILYAGGFLAQLLGNYATWKQGGGIPGDGTSPLAASPDFLLCLSSVLRPPYGVYGILICIGLLAVLLIMVMRMGYGDAGAMVKTGKVKRSDKARLIRDGIVIFTGNINALKRFKDDVKEVGTNFECGISLVNCNDMKVGDMIETFEEIEVKQTL